MTRILIRLVLTAAVAALLVALAPRRALADKCSQEQQHTQKKGHKNYKTVIGPHGRKIFVIEKAFVVCGKVPKPSVIYVLEASTINYEWKTLKRDFLPKITDAVKKDPF